MFFQVEIKFETVYFYVDAVVETLQLRQKPSLIEPIQYDKTSGTHGRKISVILSQHIFTKSKST